MGKAKPLSNEILMVPNLMYMLHAWIGPGIDGNSMEDIVGVVELKRIKVRFFILGLGSVAWVSRRIRVISGRYNSAPHNDKF
jgi:hypothetical protein